jgi:hypothetical protein
LFTSLRVDELLEPEWVELGYGLSTPEEDQPIDSLLDESDLHETELGLTDTQRETLISDDQLRAAAAVLDLWADEEEDDETQRTERAHVTARILGRALRVFERAQDEYALDSVPGIMVFEPSLTPTVCRYLKACAVSHRRAVRDCLDEVCESRISSDWQRLWIANVAGELPRRRGGAELSHVRWLEEQMQSSHPAIRAEAQLALCRRRLVTREVALQATKSLPAQFQSLALMGASLLWPESDAERLAGSALDRLRIAWARERFA